MAVHRITLVFQSRDDVATRNPDDTPWLDAAKAGKILTGIIEHLEDRSFYLVGASEEGALLADLPPTTRNYRREG